MRFKDSPKSLLDTKTERKFLLLPRKLGSDTWRWLEYAKVRSVAIKDFRNGGFCWMEDSFLD